MNERSIAEQAADWVTELSEPEAGTRAAFAQWLSESPRHVEEYLLVSTLYKSLDGVDRDHEIDVELLKAAAQPNVVTLDERTASRPHRTRRWRFVAAAGIVCAAVTGGWWIFSSQGDVYSTAMGELRSVELSDGSVVELNTHSKVRVKFSDTKRSLELLSGEALFKVAEDPARPFTVRSDAAVIQALGTQFNVYQRSQDTAVAVLEGLVRVSGDASATLKAGQGTAVSPEGALAQVSPVDTSRVTAWRERKLVFIDDPLSRIVAEFNRYSASPKLRVEGLRASSRELTAVFDAGDPQSLVTFLKGLNELEVQEKPGEIVIRDR